MVFRIGLLAASVVGCAHANSGTPAPLGDVEVTSLRQGEEVSHSFYPGVHGTVLLFARNIIDEDVAEIATDLADRFVRRCDPAYDAVAVVEPGLAAMWPGIEGYAERELARRREWRADCLSARRVPRQRALSDSAEQIDLIVDDRGQMRDEMLGDADPKGDIVVAVYDADGTSVYLVTVPRDGRTVGKIVDDAIAALRSRE